MLLPSFRSLSAEQVIDLPLDALAAWSLPACVIHGIEDEIFPVGIARRMAATLPNAELHLIPGQTHALIFRQPAQVAEHLGDFRRAIRNQIITHRCHWAEQTMNNTHPIRIAPSILTADFGHLADQIRLAEAGGADYIHLDVMDGNFVPNITYGPALVETVRQVTKLPLDVHLMVHEPERFLSDYVKAGADLITVHVEACLHLHRTVQAVTEMGRRVGVALNPATPVESVREILPFVDMVLVMSVNPGFGKQRFIETSTSKLRRVRRLQDELNPLSELEVDGGIDVQNIDDVVRSGASVIVVGSSVFNSRGTVASNIAALRTACDKALWLDA